MLQGVDYTLRVPLDALAPIQVAFESTAQPAAGFAIM